MRKELKETRRQGTFMHPLQIYKMDNLSAPIDVPYHWQNGAEVLWMLRGELSLRIEENMHIGKVGDVFYINPGELHGMRAKSPDCLYLAFAFSMEWFRFSQTDEVSEKYLNPLTDGRIYVDNHLSEHAARSTTPLLQEISVDYESGNGAAWLNIKADFLKFYYCLYENAMMFRKENNNAEHTMMIRLISDYIRKNSGEELSLDRLGDEFHMSPKYFSRYFLRHFGRNFTDHLTSVRIERAKTLLAETDKEISVIAEETGFSGSSYFIRKFRENQGMTPGQYRKSVKEIRNPSVLRHC